MKKLVPFVALVLALAAVPAEAGIRNCTSAMVSLGLCRSTSEAAVCIPVPTTDPDGAGPKLAPSAELIDAFAALDNYQTTVPDPNNPSATIPNPQTRQQFAAAQVRAWLLAKVIAYRDWVAEQAKAVDTTPPDYGD